MYLSIYIQYKDLHNAYFHSKSEEVVKNGENTLCLTYSWTTEEYSKTVFMLAQMVKEPKAWPVYTCACISKQSAGSRMIRIS